MKTLHLIIILTILAVTMSSFILLDANAIAPFLQTDKMFHVKGDISRLLCVIYEATTAGMFVTKIKDFFLNLHRLKKFQQNQLFHKNSEKVSALRRDEIREGVPVHAYISINLEFDDRISIFIRGA